MEKKNIPDILIGGAFILAVPTAVLLLAVFHLRKTNALTWMVSAITVFASLRFGSSLLKGGVSKKDKKQPRSRS